MASFGEQDEVRGFFSDIFVAFPPLAPLWDEHMEFHDGELLSHILMADILWDLEPRLLHGDDKERQFVQRVVSHIEGVFARVCQDDAALSNCIAVSFVENLLHSDECVDAFRPLLGPAMANQLKLFEGV
jgi:hypothetical protein